MPILREGELDVITNSAEQTRRLGAKLGSLLEPTDVICLSGDMGAGKTVFSGGIGAGWGSTTPITSPTYNLVHQHTREKDTQILFHLDCYRLKGVEDAESIGMDDILNGRGPVILEWPEHIERVLPSERLWIDFRILEASRRNFIFQATGARYERLLSHFREQTFGV